MAYLDKDKKFYDYGTKTFDGRNPFDSTKAESSFYNQFLTDPDYMEENKNLKETITYMTPKEYFQECAFIFNSNANTQIKEIEQDKEKIQHLKEVLLKYRRTFPITYLNYAQNAQEGRHRMYVVGEVFGWGEKFPVMVVDWADKDLQKQQELEKLNSNKESIFQDIELTINKIQNNPNFDYENVFEVINDIKWELKFKYNSKDIKVNYDGKNAIEIIVKGLSYKVPIWGFDLKEYPKSNDDTLNESDESQILHDLERMGLKNW